MTCPGQSISTAAQKICPKSQIVGFGRENVSHHALSQNFLSQILGFEPDSNANDYFLGEKRAQTML
jgi:hypothetical protein